MPESKQINEERGQSCSFSGVYSSSDPGAIGVSHATIHPHQLSLSSAFRFYHTHHYFLIDCGPILKPAVKMSGIHCTYILCQDFFPFFTNAFFDFHLVKSGLSRGD